MLIEFVILLLAIPVGYLIVWMARDELVQGRKWFVSIIIASIVLGLGACLFGVQEIGWALGFIAIVSLISFLKSSDKKWVKRNSK